MKLTLVELTILWLRLYCLVLHTVFFKYRQSPTYNVSTYDFLTLQWCKSNTNSVKAVLQILNLDLFPRLAICGTIFSCDAGQWQQVTAPSQTCNHDGKQLIHLRRLCTHTTISAFTVSTVFNKLHEIFSTLLQNRHHIRWFCPTAG